MKHGVVLFDKAEAPRWLALCNCGWGRWMYDLDKVEADAAQHLRESA